MNMEKNKQCPRCRFTLAKTHSEKMICKRCGYTSNKLQIVTQQDAFDVNFKFNKKIHVKKLKQQSQLITKIFDILSTNIEAFRNSIYQSKAGLKSQLAVKTHLNFQKSKQLKKQLQLWFLYLQKMTKQSNFIGGMFKTILKKQKSKQKQSTNKKQNKPVVNLEQYSSEQENSSSDEQKLQNKEKQVNINPINREQISQQQYIPKIDKKKPKSYHQKDQILTLFKKAFNSTLKSMNFQFNQIKQIQIISKQKPSRMMLREIFRIVSHTNQQKVSFNSLIYLSAKYTLILSLQRQYISILSIMKNNKKKNSKILKSQFKHFIQKISSNGYVKQQDLRIFCKQRAINYEKRRLYTELTIINYDCMKLWYQRNIQTIPYKNSLFTQSTDLYPYPFLLQVYKSSYKVKQSIIQLLNQNLQRMSEQALIKMQQNQKSAPQLSFKFICALIYLALMLNGKCFMILQIVSYSYKNLQEYLQQQKEVLGHEKQWVNERKFLITLLRQKNIRVRRVKKLAHHVLKYLQSQVKLSITNQILIVSSVKKWALKIGKKFNLPYKNLKQYIVLTQTLTKGYLQMQQKNNYPFMNNNSFMKINNFSSRFINIQQPQIVLSCLIIYLKLMFGMNRDKYPYLINIAEQWKNLQKRGDIKFLSQESIGQYKNLQKIMKQNQKIFGKVSDQDEIQEKQQFSLQKLYHSINNASFPIYTNIQQLKYLQGLKQIQNISNKIRFFNNLLQIQQKHDLNLTYNLNYKSHSNEYSNDKKINIQSHRENQIVPVIVNLFTIDNRNSKDKPQIFRNSKLNKKIQFSQDLTRQIDFIVEKQKKRQSIQNKCSIQIQNQQSTGNKIKKLLDHPSKHYEMIYHPTINCLTQLQMHEILLFVQSISYFANGQYSDCKDVLEWVGFMQTILIEYED